MVGSTVGAAVGTGVFAAWEFDGSGVGDGVGDGEAACTGVGDSVAAGFLVGFGVEVGMILSRLVDTFSSRILYPMLPLSENHSIAVV